MAPRRGSVNGNGNSGNGKAVRRLRHGCKRPRSAAQKRQREAHTKLASAAAAKRRATGDHHDGGKSAANADGKSARRQPSRLAPLLLHVATPHAWRPTHVEQVQQLPPGVEAALRAETLQLAELDGRCMRVVHCTADPHKPFAWQHGAKGGLGAVPIGDAAEWEKRERQAVEFHASRARKEARAAAIAEGIPKRGSELTRIGQSAYAAAKAERAGCFEWLRAREMPLHLDLREGPVVLSKGEAPWTAEDRGLQVMGIPDFRELFPQSHPFRRALGGLEKAFTSWEALQAHRLNHDFTVAEAMAAYPEHGTSHSRNFGHFHDWTACHALSIAGRSVLVSRGVIRPRFSQPDGKAAFRALFDGLVAPILPFVWYARHELVPARYWSSHPEGATVYSSGFTYVGINFFLDGRFRGDAPAFAQWHDDDLLSTGVHYHGDRGNTRFKFGALVVMGSFEYFHQHYPAFGCTVFTPGWCMLFGDYSDLWHAVGPGSGFRISITLFDHEVCSTGVRPQDGYVIDWSKVEDPRLGAERYEPDIDSLVWYAHEYSRMCRKND